MHLRFRIVVLIAVSAFIFSSLALPTASIEAKPAAAKQITITITEAQFNRFLPSVKPRGSRGIAADIIDGGIIIKILTNWSDLPEFHEHFGVLIRDGKIVTEAGVVDLPGIGAMGYADIEQAIPELIPFLDHDARIMSRFVLRQVSAKAGSRYKPESVVTGGDKVVIVVNK
jgi:hypothetical protein